MKAEDWVRVGEALPGYGEEVLCTDGERQRVCSREFTDNEGEHWMISDDNIADEPLEFEDVIAWQPLPGLPEILS